MSLRSTKSRISGKIAAGGFKQPDNTLTKAIDTGAGIMAKGIMTRAAEEREEKRIAKREAAAEAKRLAAAQAKKEEEAKKLARNAKVLAQDFTGTTDNAAAVTYFQNQLELMGGDVSAVISSTENRVKSGQLEFVPPTTEMVDTPFQGPNVPANAPLKDFGGKVGSNKFKTGEDVTLGDLPNIITNEKNSSGLRKQAEEMNAVFGGLAEGTTLPKDGSVEVNKAGEVRIKPFAKQGEIDWTSVKDPAEVKNIRRLHDAGQQVLSAEDLKVLELYESDFNAADAAKVTTENIETSRQILSMEIDDLQGVLEATDDVYNKDMKVLAQNLLKKKQDDLKTSEDKDAAANALEFSRSLISMDAEDLRRIQASGSYTPEEKSEAAAQLASLPGEPFNITDYDDIKDPTLQTIIANPKTDPEKVTALEALLSNRRNIAPKVNVDSPDYIVTYIDEAGQKQVTVAKLADGGGGFVDLTTSTPVVPAPDTAPINMELQSTLASDLAKINTPLIKPLKAARSSMVSTLRSAKKLDDLVNPVTGNPEILTTIGSVGPQILKRIGLEGKAAFDLIAGAGNTTQGLSLLDQRFATYINESNLTGPARAAALFQAEKVKMAFMFAASALGQSGQGLSDKDFSRALEILDNGSDYQTFSENLRSQTLSVIEATDVEINQFNTDGAVKILNTIDVSGQVMAGYKQTAEEFAISNNLGDAFTWAKSEVSETNTLPVINSKAERDALPSGTKYIGPDGNVRTKK